MKLAQESIESLKKGRGLDAQDQRWLKELTEAQEEMAADMEKLQMDGNLILKAVTNSL